MPETWRTIVAAALDAREAHVSFGRAVAGIAPELRGRRPEGLPHSAWELLVHIRIAQADLIAYMEDPAYAAPVWPDGYWPSAPDPPNDASWDEEVAAVRRGRARLRELVTELPDATAAIPWGGDHTFLRCILVALDHEAYHLGQLVLVRRLVGAWPG